VIRGTLTAPTGERRDFHGWLELSTALETILDPGADRENQQPRDDRRRDQSAI
jgi:hypothetical protein